MEHTRPVYTYANNEIRVRVAHSFKAKPKLKTRVHGEDALRELYIGIVPSLPHEKENVIVL